MIFTHCSQQEVTVVYAALASVWLQPANLSVNVNNRDADDTVARRAANGIPRSHLKNAGRMFGRSGKYFSTPKSEVSDVIFETM